ncbi:glycosyltransferase family 4 protein [Microbaculum sp. FT89]|uniref:glycosyltransferase family 4 protein n=1 Tax=Microbaculum sp. FT89 TaxID=3447298 RepID=UPI003F52CB90
MKVLVFPHSMEIGGSQLNAIELAAAVRDRGHDVAVVSGSGPLVDKVREFGVDHIPLPDEWGHMSLRTHRFLKKVIRDRGIDVVHGYEWPPAMALYFGPHLFQQVPLVCTVMSMAVAHFLPRTMPLVVGTDDIRKTAVAAGHTAVTLLEPPVDTGANAPSVDGAAFRSAYGLDPDKVLLVVVGRLSSELKREGLLAACDAAGSLAGRGLPVELAIIGDGPVREELAERARMANARAGRRAVVLTGSLMDPRAAYAAADIVLGMGGSALRGMAFGKPLIVQGELGFWRLCTPQTVDEFLAGGWYGLGDLAFPVGDDGIAVGADRLCSELGPLLADPDRRRALGAFGRDLVVDRFSLARAADVQEKVYASAIAMRDRAWSAETARSAHGLLGHYLRRKSRYWLGAALSEDFNAIAAQKRSTGAA